MSDPKSNTGGRVLFADDDTFFQSGLTRVLERLGFDCCCAASSSEALEHLQKAEFDVVLADIHMPGNYNLEFVHQISRIVPGMPVILLTGLPAMETAARAVQLPVTAYLVKPPNTEELVALLTQATRDQQSRRALTACRKRLQQWDGELQEIEHQFRQRPGHRNFDPSLGFVSLTLRNLILTLVDFERSVATLCRQNIPAPIHQAELVAALRRAVSVLEKTRQNFKSKDLGELRQDLERLLGICGQGTIQS